MGRILFAWELGAGYGHIRIVEPVASALKARGHDVLVASKDLARARPVFDAAGLTAVEAPRVPAAAERAELGMSFAELLARCGWFKPEAIVAGLRGWLELFDRFRPDLVIADHAPTALLAARIAGVKRGQLGTGFQMPSPGKPLPSLRPWQPDDPKMEQLEHWTKTAADRALAELRAPPLDRLADIFDVEGHFLTTWPEFDHYGPRAGAEYLGPIYSSDPGGEHEWPPGEGRRVLVYVWVEPRKPDALFAALRRLGLPTLAHVSGASPERRRELSGPSLRVADGPLDLDRAIPKADLTICHGGQGTLAPSLLAGKPTLLLPVHLEQSLQAYRVATNTGAAAAVNGDRGADELAQAIGRVAGDRGMARASAAFARRYAGYDPRRTVAEVARRCDALAAV